MTWIRWVALTSAAILLAAGGASCSNDEPDVAPTTPPSAATATTVPATTTPPTTTRAPRPSSPPPTTTKAAVAYTTVTLKVLPVDDSACGRCEFAAFTNVGGKLTRLATKVYPRDALTWRVPASATRNMAFAVARDRFGLPEQTVSGLVMQYEGVPVGTRLTPDEARTQRSGSWCWVGTKQRSITLEVVTLKVRYGSATDDDAYWYSVIPYTSPMAGANDNYRPARSFPGELKLETGYLDDQPTSPICR